MENIKELIKGFKTKFHEDKKVKIGVLLFIVILIGVIGLVVFNAVKKSNNAKAYAELTAGYDYVYTEEEFKYYLDKGEIRYPQGMDETLYGMIGVKDEEDSSDVSNNSPVVSIPNEDEPTEDEESPSYLNTLSKYEWFTDFLVESDDYKMLSTGHFTDADTFILKESEIPTESEEDSEESVIPSLDEPDLKGWDYIFTHITDVIASNNAKVDAYCSLNGIDASNLDYVEYMNIVDKLKITEWKDTITLDMILECMGEPHSLEWSINEGGNENLSLLYQSEDGAYKLMYTSVNSGKDELKENLILLSLNETAYCSDAVELIY